MRRGPLNEEVAVSIENLLSEERSFPPAEDFTSQANAQPGIHEEASQDPAAYWLQQAKTRLTWDQEPTVALDDSNAPFFKWFSDGELN
ncbi:MAG: acetyl-coenzyme A synthetase, partial [Acidimicrobiia bacterium]|nr:acetyl-coenzyme A synthetase [Acidimicrobiia bacterium]